MGQNKRGKNGQIFCNLPEEITREARWLVFYKRDKLSFNQNLRGNLPPIDEYLFKVRVNNISNFDRQVDRTTRDYNRFSKIKIEEKFFPIKIRDIDELMKWERKNAYVVLLVTNDDIQVFGNHIEPMSFRVEDAVRDDATGLDAYNLIVEGSTTVPVRFALLPEELKAKYFKVLFFVNPLE